MAEQVIPYSAPDTYDDHSSFRIEPTVEIVRGLKGSDSGRWLRSAIARTSGRFFMSFSATFSGTVGSDTGLSDLFESSGSVEWVQGNNRLLVAMAGMDITNPYALTPTNSAEVTAFAGLGTFAPGTITLRDFVPAAATTSLGAAKIAGFSLGDDDVTGISLGSTTVWGA